MYTLTEQLTVQFADVMAVHQPHVRRNHFSCFEAEIVLKLLKRNHLAGQLWAVIVPHCGAGYGVGGGGAAQRAEAAKGNEYFICRLLVLTNSRHCSILLGLWQSNSHMWRGKIPHVLKQKIVLKLLKRNHLAGQLWAVIVPHCGAGYGVGGGGAAQRAEAAKGNEYFICRLLVLTIDGKQGYPAAQLASVAGLPAAC